MIMRRARIAVVEEAPEQPSSKTILLPDELGALCLFVKASLR